MKIAEESLLVSYKLIILLDSMCVFQELIKLIKTSRIPIICICNDRQHTKIRSLANYCYDLRFQRPKVDQIKVLCVCCFHACNHYPLGCHDEGGIPRADQNHR